MTGPNPFVSGTSGWSFRLARRRALPMLAACLSVALLGAISVDISRADLARHRLEHAMGAACAGMSSERKRLGAWPGERAVDSLVRLHLTRQGFAPTAISFNAALNGRQDVKSVVEMPTRAMSLFGADRMTIAVEVNCGSSGTPTLAWAHTPEG